MLTLGLLGPKLVEEDRITEAVTKLELDINRALSPIRIVSIHRDAAAEECIRASARSWWPRPLW